MAKKLDAWQKQYQTEEDLRALTRVQELQGEKTRLTAAQNLATKQAAEHQKAAKLAQTVARRPPPKVRPKAAAGRRGGRKR